MDLGRSTRREGLRVAFVPRPFLEGRGAFGHVITWDLAPTVRIRLGLGDSEPQVQVSLFQVGGLDQDSAVPVDSGLHKFSHCGTRRCRGTGTGPWQLSGSANLNLNARASDQCRLGLGCSPFGPGGRF
jgi:hypothetical protein